MSVPQGSFQLVIATMSKPATCAHCHNLGEVTHNGRVYRCGFCGRRPVVSRVLPGYAELVITLPVYADNRPESRGRRGGGYLAWTKRGRAAAGTREYCRVCEKPTAERKPFCEEHLDRLPYVQKLMAEIQKRGEEEESAVKRGGHRAVDLQDSITVNDVLICLFTKGTQTVARLAIMVETTKETLEPYLKAMSRDRLVNMLHAGSRRGTMRNLVELAPAGHERVTELFRDEDDPT